MNESTSLFKQNIDSAVGFPILQIEVLRTQSTGTQIPKLADRLGRKIKDLVNEEHPAHTKHSEHHDLSGGNRIK